jgi:hypothetical protein
MSEKFFVQDRIQLLAVCDFKPFGNKTDDNPSDSETITNLRATLRQLSEISVSENLESYRLQGESLSAEFDGIQPYVAMKDVAESTFGPALDGTGGKIAEDVSDLNELNNAIERAILSMDFNKSSGFNTDLKNNVNSRVDELVPTNPEPYFADVKFDVSNYLTNLRDHVLEDAGFTDGEKSQFSSTKVFYYIVELAAQLMNSQRPKILDDDVPGVEGRRADSDAYIFRKTIEYDLINPSFAEKPPKAERTDAQGLWTDIKEGGSGTLSGVNITVDDDEPQPTKLTGADAFEDEYTMAQHFLALARELSTSVVVGKYEEELTNQSSASPIALRAQHSGLLQQEGATQRLNRQVTNPKTLTSNETFPVLPAIVIGSSGPIGSTDQDRDLFFPDRYLATRVDDSQFPEHETRPGSIIDGQVQASIFEQLDVNAPSPIGNVEGTRNYLIQALVQSEAPSIRSQETGNLGNSANRITSIEDAFQAAVEDYITYISQCASINGMGTEGNLDPVRVSKILFCNPVLPDLLRVIGGAGLNAGFDTGASGPVTGGPADDGPIEGLPLPDDVFDPGASESATLGEAGRDSGNAGNPGTLLGGGFGGAATIPDP